MRKPEGQLEELGGFVGRGGGFGSPDAVEQHQREIEFLKFKNRQTRQSEDSNCQREYRRNCWCKRHVSEPIGWITNRH